MRKRNDAIVNELKLIRAGIRKINLEQVQKDIIIIKEELREHKEESLGRFSDVMGELKTIREEMTIGAHQHEELEERVEALEKQSTSSVSLP